MGVNVLRYLLLGEAERWGDRESHSHRLQNGKKACNNKLHSLLQGRPLIRVDFSIDSTRLSATSYLCPTTIPSRERASICTSTNAAYVCWFWLINPGHWIRRLLKVEEAHCTRGATCHETGGDRHPFCNYSYGYFSDKAPRWRSDSSRGTQSREQVPKHEVIERVH